MLAALFSGKENNLNVTLFVCLEADERLCQGCDEEFSFAFRVIFALRSFNSLISLLICDRSLRRSGEESQKSKT